MKVTVTVAWVKKLVDGFDKRIAELEKELKKTRARIAALESDHAQ